MSLATQHAIERAWNFEGAKNDDWEPYITTFPDLKIPDMPFCLVPAGSFMMGSNDRHFDDEHPAHLQVIKEPYWLAKFTVTNRQWAQAMREGFIGETSEICDRHALKWLKDPKMCDAPVVGITWFMARGFARWMGCRLPSTLDWEYAARGVESWIYPWGNQWNDNIPIWYQNSRSKLRVLRDIWFKKNWHKNDNSKPSIVTNKPEGASWVGAYHMSGNVWEWVNTIFQDYPYRPLDGRERTTGDGVRVRRILRGGMWSNSAYLLRASCHLPAPPWLGYMGYGFRIALSLRN